MAAGFVPLGGVVAAVDSAVLRTPEAFDEEAKLQQLAQLFLEVFGPLGEPEDVLAILEHPQTRGRLGEAFFRALTNDLTSSKGNKFGGKGLQLFSGKKGGKVTNVNPNEISLGGNDPERDRNDETGIQKHLSVEGFYYYFDPKTKKSHWILPPDAYSPWANYFAGGAVGKGKNFSYSSSSSTTQGGGGPPPLRIVDRTPETGEAEDWLLVGSSNWLKVTTSTGLVFFHNKESGKSVWEAPEEIKDDLEALEAAVDDLDDFIIPDEDDSSDDERVPQREDAFGNVEQIPQPQKSAPPPPAVVTTEKPKNGPASSSFFQENEQENKTPNLGRAVFSKAAPPPSSAKVEDDSSSSDDSDSDDNSSLAKYNAFKQMIVSLNIVPLPPKHFAKPDYTNSLPKMLHDARFKAIPAQERKALFDVMCKKIFDETAKKVVDKKKEAIENFKIMLASEKKVLSKTSRWHRRRFFLRSEHIIAAVDRGLGLVSPEL